MENQIAMKIQYYALRIGDDKFAGEKELYEFKSKIHEKYISTFEIEAAERGGKNFFIELLYNISLRDFLLFILGGAVWDLIKGGTKQFILRPFIRLYKNFRKSEGAQEIRDITFIFNDARVNIYSIFHNKPEVNFELIGKIFSSLAKNFQNISNKELKGLKSIHIPVFWDTISFKYPIYRTKLEFDEPLELDENSIKEEDYFDFWGLEYFDNQRQVYKVSEEKLISERWFTENEFYWEMNQEKNTKIKDNDSSEDKI